jgi:hypothetical protein
MPRPSQHVRLGRAALVLTLTVILPAAAMAVATAHEQAVAAAQQADEQQRDPDQRAAGGERVENEEPGESAATLLLTPSRQRVPLGAELRLSLAVLGADDLRRLPATVRYDADLLEFVAVRLGAAWDDRSQPVLLHDSSRSGEVVIGLGLLDKEVPGISGSAELLELVFRAVGAGDARVVIERYAVIAGDSRPEPVRALAAEISVR